MIEQTNPALTTLTGLDATILHGAQLVSLLHNPQDSRLLETLMQRARTLQDAQGIELQLRGAQGESVPVDFNTTARYDTRQRCVGYVFVGRPTAEIQRAYRQLHDAHEALKRTQQQLLHAEKLSSLGRLVAGVAHELNNPISFVLGNVHALDRYTQRLRQYLLAVQDTLASVDAPHLRLLEQRLRLNHILEDLPSLMQGMREGAERTAAIVDGLKRFSALDSETREAVALAPLIERSVTWVRKGMTQPFEVHITPCPEVRVWGNEGQLQQVLMNLVQNAYDATSSQPGQDGVLHIAVDARHDWCTIAFHDNGPGMDEDALLHMFDPFFTTKPVGKGTGLGLSISYGIIERHGGQLRAANHPDGGAVLTLHLPTAP